MENRIIELLCEVKEDDLLKGKITPNSSIVDDIGLDSLQMINFVLLLQDNFDMEIDFETFDYSHMSSVSALADFIKSCSAV